MNTNEYKTKTVLEKVNIPKATYYKRLNDFGITPQKNDKGQIFLNQEQLDLLIEGVELLEKHGIDTVIKKLNIEKEHTPVISEIYSEPEVIGETQTGLVPDLGGFIVDRFASMENSILESFKGLNKFIDEYSKTREELGEYRAKYHAELEKNELKKEGHTRDMDEVRRGYNRDIALKELELQKIKDDLKKEQDEKLKLKMDLESEKKKTFLQRIFKK